MWVEYLGDQDVDCYYNFGDGNGLEGCYVQYIYEDGGTYTITQTVVNDFGCAATATGEVSVAGSVFYAPTAFTPDGDGINDVWLPVVSGVTQYHLRITNRWGELVFESFDPDQPWLGQRGDDGQHYCPDGVYLFYVAYFELFKVFPVEEDFVLGVAHIAVVVEAPLAFGDGHVQVLATGGFDVKKVRALASPNRP